MDNYSTWKINDDLHGQFVACGVDELRPHSSYLRHRITVSASKLSALAELGDLVVREPLVITQERAIVDGYARWELARLQGRLTLRCIEYKLTEDEALQWILQRHRRSNGLNDFCRILLGLELESSLRSRARANQRLRSKNEGSSNLTEAEKRDVRAEIAAAAGVSVGNVTKVRQLLMTAHPELQQALRCGEISIHRAWLYSQEQPDKQREALGLHRGTKEIKKFASNLVSRHQAKSSPDIPDLNYLLRSLYALEPSELASVSVSVIKGSEKRLFVTEGLARSLRPYQESIATCAIKIR
jgi:hypothetical protein